MVHNANFSLFSIFSTWSIPECSSVWVAVFYLQARKLEAQLDDQMHLYRKLVSTKVDEGSENDLASGIQQLLKQLHHVISQMQAWVSSGGSEIFSHTLTRHQEIHHDLSQVTLSIPVPCLVCKIAHI